MDTCEINTKIFKKLDQLVTQGDSFSKEFSKIHIERDNAVKLLNETTLAYLFWVKLCSLVSLGFLVMTGIVAYFVVEHMK